MALAGIAAAEGSAWRRMSDSRYHGFEVFSPRDACISKKSAQSHMSTSPLTPSMAICVQFRNFPSPSSAPDGMQGGHAKPKIGRKELGPPNFSGGGLLIDDKLPRCPHFANEIIEYSYTNSL